MSENIRVSEVSDILRKQLEGINANVQLDEIGTVLQVSDGVVRIYGLRNAEANELLEFDNGIKAIVMNLDTRVQQNAISDRGTVLNNRVIQKNTAPAHFCIRTDIRT